MANDHNRNPLNTLRGLLDGHLQSPLYKSGDGYELTLALRLAMDELERRQGTLAAAYLQLLEAFLDQPRSQQPVTMHPAVLDDLAAMSDHAAVIVRRLRLRALARSEAHQ
jgi:hypothetical protein